jgi:hypothetical protein
MVKTRKEARALHLSRYFTGVECKHGHISERYSNSGHCIQCDNERKRPQDLRKKAIKKYYETNKQKCMQATKIWRNFNNKNYEYVKNSRLKNPSYYLFANAKRHASKMQRTPSWLNAGHWLEIECIYKYCSSLRRIGLNYEVDHIVPLQSKVVSGMHVPWNLQVITGAENSAKGNRI